jgi:hypothetical protein
MAPSPRHPARSPRRRSYRYNLKLIRRDYSYSLQELAELFRLHPNAVRRWIRDGLRTIDGLKPKLVHGSDVIDFLGRRQQGRKRCCAPGEMYCCRCRAPRRPAEGKVIVEQVNARQIMVRGTCELCGTRMNRGGLLERLPEIQSLLAVTALSLRLNEPTDPLVKCGLRQETDDDRLQPEE